MREVSATAVAVEDTNIRSNDQDGSTIRGNADLNVQLDGWDNIETKEIDELSSVGVKDASITTSSGNDHIEAATSYISQFEMLNEQEALNVAGGGMINSIVITGTGDDVVIGNASGDGLSETAAL